ncbi:MAG: class I SAM-dependent methyltransferase [Deltaproteobacteria bacterium]|nr:MAG: class I SAM-dependent methyltransferase [Deltaproteobacteria bacterium]
MAERQAALAGRSSTTGSDATARIVAEVRALYDAHYPVKESGVFTEYDWNRCVAALAHIRGPRVLDVGVGPGQMFNVLARDRSVEDLVGIDIRWNKKLLRPDRGRLELMDILDLQFEDASFDTVCCMEVLEHLEPIDFHKALAELRRVVSHTLVMTVPFEEPEPLWHHDLPGGHRQRFTQETIDRVFPRADRQFISRGRGKVPWIMLVEHRR